MCPRTRSSKSKSSPQPIASCHIGSLGSDRRSDKILPPGAIQVRRWSFLLAALAVAGVSTAPARDYLATGVGLENDRPPREMVVSCAALRGGMDAMVMSFAV